jgi:hypothetical protein
LQNPRFRTIPIHGVLSKLNSENRMKKYRHRFLLWKKVAHADEWTSQEKRRELQPASGDPELSESWTQE